MNALSIVPCGHLVHADRRQRTVGRICRTSSPRQSWSAAIAEEPARPTSSLLNATPATWRVF